MLSRFMTDDEAARPVSTLQGDAPEHLDLRHVGQVLEIGRSGSLTAAARRLGLSQPALSKSIAKLEVELGVRLFVREGGAAEPTHYGRLII